MNLSKRFFIVFKGMVEYLLGKAAEQIRRLYLSNKRKKLTNRTPSIIANNCVGGIIYHDLNLRFLSPTINLSFSENDYFEFLSDLEYYLKCIPEQITLDNVKYPVGVLKKNGNEVVIHFVHYTSFELAKAKWTERAERVDFDNLFILFESSCKTQPESSAYKKFKQLPYKNKRMITHSDIINDPELVNCSFYANDYKSGQILTYPKYYSKKRYLDEFDYVSFLNNRHKNS